MALVQTANSGSAKTTGVAGASLTGVVGGHGLVCFALYQSVATSLTLTDSSGTIWAPWTSVALTGAKIAVFVPVSAVGAGTHTVTASFAGGSGAWTCLIEDDQGYYANTRGRVLAAPGAGNTLSPGVTIGAAGGSVYQLAVDNTNAAFGYEPAIGALSGPQVFASFDAAIGSWGIVAGVTSGGTNPGMAPSSINDPTGADTYGVISMSFVDLGMSVVDVSGPVLVSEDVGPQQRSPYPLAMFFNRTSQTTAATPLAYMSVKTPPWEFYRDPFVSVYSVLEAYSQQTLISPNSPFVVRYRGNRPPDPPEEDLRRFDHGIYFQLSRHYTAQLVGYTIDVPDFNDHPWLEWVHPGQNPETALYAFRRQIVPANPYQFPIMWGQPKPWWVDEEKDSVNRKPDVGVLIPNARPVIILTMPNIIGLQVPDALALLASEGLIVTNLDAQDSVYPLLPPPAGTVIFQNPIAGATVSIGDPVIVVYSSGLMRLPDVGDSVANPINVVIGPNTLN